MLAFICSINSVIWLDNVMMIGLSAFSTAEVIACEMDLIKIGSCRHLFKVSSRRLVLSIVFVGSVSIVWLLTGFVGCCSCC